MLKVFKYPVPMSDEFTLKLPHGATILSVQQQHDVVCMWALVDTAAEIETRVFRLAGTGHEIAQRANQLIHISTFQLQGGRLVFHVFEII